MFRYVTHLGEGLLVIVFELLGVDVELVLVCGEWVIVLCNLGEKLLDLHRHALAAVLEGFDRNVGGSDSIWGKHGRGWPKVSFFGYRLDHRVDQNLLNVYATVYTE